MNKEVLYAIILEKNTCSKYITDRATHYTILNYKMLLWPFLSWPFFQRKEKKRKPAVTFYTTISDSNL